MRSGFYASLIMLGLAGCTTTGEIPDSLLNCPQWPSPAHGSIRKDSGIIDYIEEGRQINATCHANMQGIIQFKKGRAK